MKLGAHVPIGKGLDFAVSVGHSLGCEVIQVFTSNPRGWKFSVRSDDEILAFKNKLDKFGMSAYGHSIYLINIASSNTYIYENSINSLISGLILANKANLKGVVTHIGSHTGTGYKNGLKQVLQALEQVLSATNGEVPILLETDAGSGNRLGCQFSDIKDIINGIKSNAVKVCFDTCHTFVSGYDVRSEKGLEKVLNDFDSQIGLDNLKLLHLNDSKGELGSSLDRHEIIGDGYIGKDAFERILNHPKLINVDSVVETPDLKTLGDEFKSLEILRKLRK